MGLSKNSVTLNLSMMTTPDSTTSSVSGLSFAGCFPLAWRPVDALPAASQQAELAAANGEILKALLLLDAPPGELGDDADPGAQATARLDLKLNLLLDLMGQLLLQQRLVPQPRSLTLTPQGLVWQDDDAPVVDSLLGVELYCSMQYPRALVLHGRVVEVTPESPGWRIQLAFEGIEAALQEALERFIFIHHRRAIAQRRRRIQ